MAIELESKINFISIIKGLVKLFISRKPKFYGIQFKNWTIIDFDNYLEGNPHIE